MNANAPLDIPAYLLLGSNIRPEVHLPQALNLLRQRAQVFAVSRVWETPPVGTAGPPFYNAAVGLLTDLPPEALKRRLLRPIEAQLGRVRTSDKFAPRTIDLDLVVYANEVLDPEVWQYAHIAVPLSEILPGLRHPKSGETLARCAARLLHETPSLRQVTPPGWPTPAVPPHG